MSVSSSLADACLVAPSFLSTPLVVEYHSE